MSEIEQVELVKKQVAWASHNWNLWSEQKRIEVACEIATEYKKLKDDYWRDYTWKAISFYQRVLSYVIQAMKS